MECFRALGIDVRTSATVETIEPHGRGIAVRARTPDGMLTIEADVAVHAAGRALHFGSLNPAAATSRPRRDACASTNSCKPCPGPPLTPVASREGAIVAAILLSGYHRRPNYRGVPSAAFTVPPVASVGLGEAPPVPGAAICWCVMSLLVRHERGSDWCTARQTAEPVYGYKTLVDRDTDAILGAHLVGPHAEEVINLFALAIRTSDVSYMLG